MLIGGTAVLLYEIGVFDKFLKSSKIQYTCLLYNFRSEIINSTDKILNLSTQYRREDLSSSQSTLSENISSSTTTEESLSSEVHESSSSSTTIFTSSSTVKICKIL